MRIQHNILAMNAYRNYTNNTSALSKNLEKLSSGYKINRAGDDAAGLAISEKMRAQITGLNAAQKNVKDGVSLVKTAEGALSEVHDMLNRMVYLATQSANGTYDGTDRVQLQKELDQLRTEINRISEASNFNGIKLLDGSMDASGGVKNVSSVSRMLQQVGTGTGNVGRVTILDSDPRIKSGNTVFEMDFTGLSTSKVQAGGGSGTNPSNNITSVTKYGDSEYTEFKIDLKDAFPNGFVDNEGFRIGDQWFKFVGSGAKNGGVAWTANVSPARASITGGGPGSKAENAWEITVYDGATTDEIIAAIVGKLNGNVKFFDKTFNVTNNGTELTFTATTTGKLHDSAGNPYETAEALQDALDREFQTFDVTPAKDPVPIASNVTYSPATKAKFDVDLAGLKSGDLLTIGSINFKFVGSGEVQPAAIVGNGDGTKNNPFLISITNTTTASAVARDIVSKLPTSGLVSLGSAFTAGPNGSQSVNFQVTVVGGKLHFEATVSGLLHDATGQVQLDDEADFTMHLNSVVTKTEGNGPAPAPAPSSPWEGRTGNVLKAGIATADAVTGSNASWDITLAKGGNDTPLADWKSNSSDFITFKAKLDDQEVYIKVAGDSGGQFVVTIGTDGSTFNADYNGLTLSAAYNTGTSKLTLTVTSGSGTHTLASVSLHGIDLSASNSGVDTTTGNITTFTPPTGADEESGKTTVLATAGKASINFEKGELKEGAKIKIGGVTIEIKASMVGATDATLQTLLNTAIGSKSTEFADASITVSVTVSGSVVTINVQEATSVASASYGRVIGGTYQAIDDLFEYEGPDTASYPMPASGIAVDDVAAPAAANAGGAAPTSGGVTPTSGGDTDTPKISFGVKLAGQTLVDAVKVDAEATAGEIAAKVWDALKNTYGVQTGSTGEYIEIKLDINGATYTVTHASDSNKLKFTLKDDPTEANINGNFDWNITGETDKFGDNHTGGTIVTTAGRAVVANQAANTIFRVEQGDIKEGATFTITAHDGTSKTVTLHIGQNNPDVTASKGNGIGHVYLTEAESRNLSTVLGRISAAFGSRVGDLEIGVNDRSNGDGHMGITVKHINTHGSDSDAKNVYLTMEDFAKVFSLKVPRNPEGKGLSLQIGDTSDSYNQLAVSIAACDSAALGLDGVDISTQVGAEKAIESIKAAINYVSDVRGTLGATQNRLEHTQNNLSVMAENIQDAESTIRDTDVAEEMMSYVKNNILIQSAQAMLAQANQIPQGVLQLLG